MGFFNFFSKKKSESEKNYWSNKIPKEYAEFLINEIKNNTQACTTDEIPQGFGEFGLEKTNPIPINGIPSNITYLNSLITLNGEILRYRRTGSIEVENINHLVDEYEIFNQVGETIAFLYLSSYHLRTSKKSPIGFYFKGESKKTQVSESLITAFNQKSVYYEHLRNLRNQELKNYHKQSKQYNRFKSNWEEFRDTLNQNSIYSLFHFTDRSNLESIRKYGGLYSWSHCEKNNIKINLPGGNQLSRDLDTRKGLEDYVRVSFTRNHPMMFIQPLRNRRNVILEIDTEVIYWKGTQYSDKNATRNDVNFGSKIEDFNRLQFDLFKSVNQFKLSETEKPYYQGEVLVNNHIPIKFIKNINELLGQNDIY